VLTVFSPEISEGVGGRRSQWVGLIQKVKNNKKKGERKKRDKGREEREKRRNRKLEGN